MSETPVAATPAPPELPEDPSSSPKKRSRIWIPLVIVFAVVILGLAAAAALFLMRDKGGDAPEMDLIADIASEPDDVWSFDFAPSDDEFISGYPSYVEVDDDSILIWATVDSYALDYTDDDSYGWYEGYDEEYDAGYDAGYAYYEAVELWLADETYTLEYPSEEDFYPEDAYSFGEGWWDGFYDGSWGDPWGTSAVPQPVEPDFPSPEVAKVDLKTGDELWTLDVIGKIDNFDYYSGLTASAVPDTDYTVFIGREEETSTATLISVDNNTGDVASEATIDDFAQLVATDGGVFVLVTPDDDDPVLSRLDPEDLEADAVWEADVDDAWALQTIGDDYIGVEGDGGGFVFAAADGSEPEWGDDFGDGVGYGFIGDQLIRFEADEDDEEYEITGVTPDGDSSWDSPVTAEWVSVNEGGLFVADEATDGVEDVMRLNPKTGAEMWKEAWKDEIYASSGAVMAFSGVVALPEVDSEKLAVVNAKTGEELFTERINDTQGFWPGENYFYMQSSDELEAFPLKEGGSVWSYGFDEESETILSIGDKLYVLDFEKFSISLLAED